MIASCSHVSTPVARTERRPLFFRRHRRGQAQAQIVQVAVRNRSKLRNSDRESAYLSKPERLHDKRPGGRGPPREFDKNGGHMPPTHVDLGLGRGS